MELILLVMFIKVINNLGEKTQQQHAKFSTMLEKLRLCIKHSLVFGDRPQNHGSLKPSCVSVKYFAAGRTAVPTF